MTATAVGLGAAQMRDTIVGAWRAQQRYRFIDLAYRYLAEAPHDPELVSNVVDALIEVGLPGAALELLQTRRDAPAHHATRRDRLRRSPSGRIAWRDLQAVFDANVAVLVSRQLLSAETVPRLRQAVRRLQLFRTADGHCQLSSRLPGGMRRWIPRFTDYDDEAVLELPAKGALPATVVLGLSCGPALGRVAAATERLFHNMCHPLLVLERDPVRLAAWLYSADRRPLLTQERFLLFFEDQTFAALADYLLTNEDIAIPGAFVALGHDPTLSSDEAQRTCQRVGTVRQSELQQLLTRLEERYRDRNAAYWADRWQRPGPVLGITSRHTTMLQHSMRDAAEALSALGYPTEVMIESADHRVLSPAAICRKILELDPILFLSLDHHRYEVPFLPANLPFLGWNQDPLPNVMCPEAGAAIGPLDFVCGYFFKPCTEQYGYPPERFFPCPLPISTRRLHDRPLDAPTEAKYQADVVFVSNASTPVERYHRDQLAQAEPSHRPAIQAVFDHINAMLERGETSLDADAALRAVSAETGHDFSELRGNRFDEWYVRRIFDWGWRQRTLTWVADWADRTGRCLKLYGLGWEQHPRFARYAAGPIEHGEPLRCAYRAAKLSLQLLCSGFAHQRSYESLAAGCLVVTRYVPNDFAGYSVAEFQRRRRAGNTPASGAACVFPGFERVVFDSPASFASLAERLIADDDHRRRILDDFRRVVAERYTYRGVVAGITDRIRQSLHESAARLSPPAGTRA